MRQLPNLLLTLQNTPPPEGSVEKMFGLMLYGAVRHQHPQRILELGTGKGYSTAWMLLGLEENEEGHIWSCDLIAAERPVWQAAQIPESRLTYYSNDPVDSLKDKLPAEFDLVFHDAGHSLDEVKNDFDWILPRIAVNGSLVIHDVAYSSAMGDWVLDYFDSKPDEWKFERILEGCGVGIATRIKQTEVPTCKEESSGSTTPKGTGSSKGKTEKITSRIIRKSSKPQGVRRSPKIKILYSSRQQKQKGCGRKALSSNGVE